MYRVLSVLRLATALFIGYSLREPRVSAQTLTLPYYPGDSVRLDYADGQTRPVCEIAQFYGSFLSCKVASSGFAAPEAPPRVMYNLNTVISIQLVKKADLSR